MEDRLTVLVKKLLLVPLPKTIGNLAPRGQ